MRLPRKTRKDLDCWGRGPRWTVARRRRASRYLRWCDRHKLFEYWWVMKAAIDCGQSRRAAKRAYRQVRARACASTPGPSEKI